MASKRIKILLFRVQIQVRFAVQLHVQAQKTSYENDHHVNGNVIVSNKQFETSACSRLLAAARWSKCLSRSSCSSRRCGKTPCSGRPWKTSCSCRRCGETACSGRRGGK